MSRTAIVTGASRGIGLATAARLLEDGFSVVGCSRRPGEAASALAGLGEEAVGIEADVSEDDDVVRLVGTAVDRFGGVDVLVNNAGVYEEVDFLDMTVEQWNRVMTVNATGAFLCSRRAARVMIDSGSLARGGGRIVNVASSTGILSEQRCAHYNASKAALISLTRSLALDLAEHGILTTCVAPGWVDTGIDPALDALAPEQMQRLNPLGRSGTPGEIAHAVAVLCDPRASFVNGAILSVDGGQAAVSPAPEGSVEAGWRPLSAVASRGVSAMGTKQERIT